MKTDAIPLGREPDVQIILKTNPGTLTSTQMIGAADICIEIVSPSSEAVDRVDKVREYAASGVQAYWLCDYNHEAMLFYRLNAAGNYQLQHPDAEGMYTTPLLPKFRLHVPTLWQDPLPNIMEAVKEVKAMFAK